MDIRRIGARQEKVLIEKHADEWRKDNGYVDFLEQAEKEKAELNESYKESKRQAEERKRFHPVHYKHYKAIDGYGE